MSWLKCPGGAAARPGAGGGGGGETGATQAKTPTAGGKTDYQEAPRAKTSNRAHQQPGETNTQRVIEHISNRAHQQSSDQAEGPG
jgi:hypothetical protein